MRLLILPKLFCLLIMHLNGLNGRHYFFRWSLCFGFFASPCYNRRIHYPTLEKPVDQNITACENQGKQCELSDQWKSIKTFLKKTTENHAKMTKRLTVIQVLTKDFTSYKAIYKSLRIYLFIYLHFIYSWQSLIIHCNR